MNESNVCEAVSRTKRTVHHDYLLDRFLQMRISKQALPNIKGKGMTYNLNIILNFPQSALLANVYLLFNLLQETWSNKYLQQEHSI